MVRGYTRASPSSPGICFFWHDDWIYETLPGGNIETSPALTDDGSLTMRGTFSAREDSPPIKYALRITPADEELRVRCEVQKSAALKLTRGIWLHLSGSRDSFQGSERVWFAPSAHGTVSATPSAPANRVLLELHEGRSLCLGLPGYRPVENEGSTRAHAFASISYPMTSASVKRWCWSTRFRLLTCPEHFPGQIESARATAGDPLRDARRDEFAAVRATGTSCRTRRDLRQPL